jgi:hypothetical protein
MGDILTSFDFGFFVSLMYEIGSADGGNDYSQNFVRAENSGESACIDFKWLAGIVL